MVYFVNLVNFELVLEGVLGWLIGEIRRVRTVACLSNMSVLGIITLVIYGFHHGAGYHFAYMHHIFDPCVPTI